MRQTFEFRRLFRKHKTHSITRYFLPLHGGLADHLSRKLVFDQRTSLIGSQALGIR
jgi:hypothetical protein